jgi:hypothetical protein
VERINDRERFIAFASEIGVRPDWHEPDEQGITARVEGTSGDFDNAGFWPASAEFPSAELHVIFSRLDVETGVRGRDLACVNLATLCAWAAQR